ncbi:MAG: prepilin-type N-terminal cleavage/methylation domain-containing protein [Candidatus Gracilibacteria bacterium]|nr:prepilin-type N-terminal cleavage/methylation domain-containing protein [Candidatus Gracilibacteria bacterium]
MFNLFIIFPPMKLQRIKSGFTLIELLVVITIIGILATGAVSVYTSQIQRARDSVRLQDVTALKGGIEQYYQDNSEYPQSNGASFSGITVYTPNLPKDPKSGQARTGAAFDYIYTVGPDANSIVGQDYEISTTFEQQGNIDQKAANTIDGGNDDLRLELGIDLTGNDTQVTGAINAGSLTCVATAGGPAILCAPSATKLVIK